MLSKVATFAVQFLAVPVVYRALGETGYAAYAAVTTAAGLMLALNLGIGGSLVTPIADAAAQSDERRQAALVQSGLGPLILLCLVGSLVAIPAVTALPLHTLFGRVGIAGDHGLRIAAVIAVSATLAAVPLSSVMFLRQAYQEMHVTNLIGAVANGLLCVGLLVAAKLSAPLPVFVSLFVLIPLAAQGVNLVLLFVQRKFLIRGVGRSSLRESRHLIGDGIRFVAADFTSVLLYQWPVYWVTRTLPPGTSSWFAICTQAIVLQLSFGVGLLMPVWPSTADAMARADHEWLQNSIRKGRTFVLLVGSAAFLSMLVLGQRFLDLWLRRPLRLGLLERGLMGLYVLLAVWEFYHFMLALGLGRLREAAIVLFVRSLVFAISVPLLARFGGVPLVWCGMCFSIIFSTAWFLPKLIRQSAVMVAA